MKSKNTLVWGSKSMNSEFKVKLSGCGYHNYVGWSGFCAAVGFPFVCDALSRAFESQLDKYVIKLRRGLKIEIYSK